MKKVVIRSFGGPDVLRYEDVETPRPRSGHILVKILAADVNRLDHYLREAAVAHRLIASNQVKGNLVLLPWAA